MREATLILKENRKVQRRVQIVHVVTPRQFYFRHNLAYKRCACSTSGSQNRAIAKRHAANKNKDNTKVAWSNLTINSICCSKGHNYFPNCRQRSKSELPNAVIPFER